MSDFRADPLFGTVCLVARERASRPHRMRIRDEIEFQGPCPLCPGNESLTPPEVGRIEVSGRWETRAFPNRYPALTLESDPRLGDLASLTSGKQESPAPFGSAPGFGVHEIIVDSPSHAQPFWFLDPDQSVQVFSMIQRRISDLYQDQRILYTQIYKNHRAGSGGSLEHPHFQLIGLPFIPQPVMKLLTNDNCAVCALIRNEMKDRASEKEKKSDKAKSKGGGRFLAESSWFIALADYAPSYSYQFSVYPKFHSSGFEETRREELDDLSQLLTLVMGRFERLMGEFALNLVLFTQPNPKGFAKPKDLFPWQDSMHWFFRVYPRLGRHAGFELGTGIPLIQVAPEDAARTFREKGL